MTTQILYPKSESVIAQEAALTARPKVLSRLVFVDNLRIFLTILVILHHLMNIYAASGGWVYQEGRQDMVTALLGKWFTTVNQAYFMGLFMLISAYFVPGSCDRKGTWRFVKDRLVRLGIPLVVYSWLLRPALIYAALSGLGEVDQSYFPWLTQHYFREYNILGGGPLWFISALLIFSIVYAVLRRLLPVRPVQSAMERDFPSNARIALFAGMIALASFIVRLWYPSDRVFIPLGFQFADFPQYAGLFILGIVAYRQNWLVRLPEKVGRLWMIVALVLILLWPPIVILLGAFENIKPFLGGWHWQAVLSAAWQSFLGIAMCIGVVSIFLQRLNYQGRLAKFLSPNAYTAYLIHETVITFAAVLVMGVLLYPLLKFSLLAIVAIPLIFGLSALIRKLPFTEKIL